ncbi:MAG: thioredoxin family protein [bacterium]
MQLAVLYFYKYNCYTYFRLLDINKYMKVLKFGAEWCAGCLVMKPLWREIEEEVPWLETEYYDYDQNQEKAKEYNINETLPAFVFLDKDNQEILRLTGEISKDELMEIIEENKEK